MLKGLFATGLLLCLSNTALAAVSAEEAAKLGSSLTPLGGDKAANAAGTIPAWNGGITQAPVGYAGPGHHHVDPFAGDKPLFTISKANLEQYQEIAVLRRNGMGFDELARRFAIPVSKVLGILGSTSREARRGA